MPDVSVTVMATPAGGALLIAGYVLALVLYLLGTNRRNMTLIGGGMFLAGLMVLATDLALFLAGPPPSQGEYRLTASDVVVAALLGFLGGALSMLGASYLTLARRLGRAAGA